MSAGPSPEATPLLSVVIPTYNERENLERLLREVTIALEQEGIAAELVVVDDNSPDGTGELAESLRAFLPGLRVLHRPGKQGLATAVLAGFAIAKGDVLAVMDADFSHPTDLVARLALTQQATGADIVVGSRYIPGGSIVGWPWRRKLASRVASWLARPFTAVHDPLSGCFLLRRAVIEGVPLSPTGFKILLEVLVKGRYAHIEEVPYTFHDRRLGKSKMGPAEIMRYLVHLGRLALWRLQHKRPGVEQGTFAR